jgi:hypothetical protein
MKLEGYDKDYYALSAKAGDVARQLALAGIAVVWLFKVDSGGVVTLPKVLVLPTFAFAISLAMDLMHYLVATVTWGSFALYQRKINKKADADEIVDPPGFFNWPAIVFFTAKSLAVLVGYWWLFEYLQSRIAVA